MRLATGFTATALLCLLAGAVGASIAGAQPESDPANFANATNVVTPQAETDAAMNASMAADARTSQIDACVADPSIHLPNGTNANLFCTCAVDKTLNSGVAQRDAIFQCAAQMNFAGPELRAGEISECVSGSPGHLPDGTDANAFCTCAVDKMLANTPQQTAINQCATELHITLLSGDEDPSTNAMAGNQMD